MLTCKRLWIARDKSAQLVGFYLEKPTIKITPRVEGETEDREFFHSDKKDVYLSAMTVAAFVAVFGLELRPGECRELVVSLDEVK